jgi:dTDP-4-dehydrorhamnose 3,5-epimerase
MGLEMKIFDTAIVGVHVIEITPLTDPRGSFARTFCTRELAPVLDGREIAQINHSKTIHAGTVRGMHFQRPPHAEKKFVRCIRGRIWDVALDLRAGSPTFLQWHAEELTADNNKILLIPEGCAHGVQALAPDSEFMYFNTAFYVPESEGGIRHDDPACAITWPLPSVHVSDKDLSWPMLDRDFSGMKLT